MNKNIFIFLGNCNLNYWDRIIALHCNCVYLFVTLKVHVHLSNIHFIHLQIYLAFSTLYAPHIELNLN